MKLPISKINEEDVANFSRLLTSFDSTIHQQKIMASAVAAFVPKDAELIFQLNSFMKEIGEMVYKIKTEELSNNDIFELNELANNQRIMNNTSIEGSVVKWNATSAIECAQIYFSKNQSRLKFRFDLFDFIKFWNPALLKSKRSTSSTISRSLINGGIFDVTVNDNGKVIKETFPIFRKISITDNQYIDVTLNTEFMPYLVFYCQEILSVGYTKLPLYLIKNASSEYTMKLWLLILKRYNLKMGKTTKELTIDIDDFRSELGVIDKYTNFNGLKSKVLDKAFKDIFDVSNSIKNTERTIKLIKTEGEYYRAVFKGRKVVAIVFTIDPSSYHEHSEKAKKKRKKSKLAPELISKEKRILIPMLDKVLNGNELSLDELEKKIDGEQKTTKDSNNMEKLGKPISQMLIGSGYPTQELKDGELF